MWRGLALAVAMTGTCKGLCASPDPPASAGVAEAIIADSIWVSVIASTGEKGWNAVGASEHVCECMRGAVSWPCAAPSATICQSCEHAPTSIVQEGGHDE